ncbi:MAG: C25 family cysteine peptidase [Nanoarchaeota archaeon]
MKKIIILVFVFFIMSSFMSYAALNLQVTPDPVSKGQSIHVDASGSKYDRYAKICDARTWNNECRYAVFTGCSGYYCRGDHSLDFTIPDNFKKGTCSVRVEDESGWLDKKIYAHFELVTDIDNDGDGYFSAEDCDDDDAKANPGAEEVCDNIDNDCDSEVDEEDVCINKKNQQMYSDKEVFLISDNNWQDVMSLVPVTTWTVPEGHPDLEWCSTLKNEDGTVRTFNEKDKDGNDVVNYVCGYPMLIYHEEDNGFDADSILYFMEQYDTDKVTIVGNTENNELFGHLVSVLMANTGLTQSIIEQNNIKQVQTSDFIRYWINPGYVDVVYVEDNYDLALMASSYASLINAPLIVQNSIQDDSNECGLSVCGEHGNAECACIFDGSNIIQVGNVPCPLTASGCEEFFQMDSLIKKYIDITRTNKIILANPTDLSIYLFSSYYPGKSINQIFNMYTKTSLSSPILASAKHELIILDSSNDYVQVDNALEESIINHEIYPQYLTIMAAPNAIPATQKVVDTTTTKYFEVDNTIYGDLKNSIDPVIEGDMIPELSVGRIYSLTSSDVSSVLARILYFSEISPIGNDMTLVFEDASNALFKYSALAIEKTYIKSGYNVESRYSGLDKIDPNCWNIANLSNIEYLEYTNKYWGRYTCVWSIPGKEYPSSQECYDSIADVRDEIPFGITAVNKDCAVSFAFSPAFFNEDVVFNYLDHGGTNGYMYLLLPFMPQYDKNIKPKLVISEACLTCSFDEAQHIEPLFCANVIRKGAIGHIGAIDDTYSDSFGKVINENILLGKSIGEALKSYYTGRGINYKLIADYWAAKGWADKVAWDKRNTRRWWILLGDPTFNFGFDGSLENEVVKSQDYNVLDNKITLRFDFPEIEYNPSENTYAKYTTDQYVLSHISSDNLYYSYQYTSDSSSWHPFFRYHMSLFGEVITDRLIENVQITLVDIETFKSTLNQNFAPLSAIDDQDIYDLLIPFNYFESANGYFYHFGTGSDSQFSFNILDERFLQKTVFPAYTVEVEIELGDLK